MDNMEDVIRDTSGAADTMLLGDCINDSENQYPVKITCCRCDEEFNPNQTGSYLQQLCRKHFDEFNKSCSSSNSTNKDKGK